MQTIRSTLLVVGFSVAVIHASFEVRASDWPMWRYDAGHTAYSPHTLPTELKPLWSRSYGKREQVWDDPLNHDLMPYDRVFEPIIKDGRVVLPFNDSDKVVALDAATGGELWTFYCNGPVRFPAVAWQDKIFFVSDDGYLYSVFAENGQLDWKFQGAPSNQKAIGNQRLISAWPARGGPVVYEDQVYFAASIWPFMGTFIFALDAEDGGLVWVNDSTSADYILQPHSAPSFAGVAPQGTLTATADKLLVPGGRSVPAGLDRMTGEQLYFRIGGKGDGGSFVAAGADEFFVHTRMQGVKLYDLKTGSATSTTMNEPVITDEIIYTSDETSIRALDAKDKSLLWRIQADASGDLILAGDHLYAAGSTEIVAIDLGDQDSAPAIDWRWSIDNVKRLAAADNKLFAVSMDGMIHAFGTSESDEELARTQHPVDRSLRGGTEKRASKSASEAALSRVVDQFDVSEGFVYVVGADDEGLLHALAANEQLETICIDTRPEVVDRLRGEFDDQNRYGKSISLQYSLPESFKPPQYFAHLTVLGKAFQDGPLDEASFRTLYASVRPYGGVVWLPQGAKRMESIKGWLAEEDAPNAEFRIDMDDLFVIRKGALPGSSDWSHMYGDIGNTVKSDDRRVRLPLGILWFGGVSNEDVLPRHGHGPPEQIVNGRMVIEGMSGLSCLDVYTGRELWKRDLPELGGFGMYYDESYKTTPLSTAYNQLHIPGANARGTNFVSVDDEVFVAMGTACHVLSARDGETLRVIEMPQDPDYPFELKWAYLGVYENVLLGGKGFADFDRQSWGDEKKTRSSDVDLSACRGLVAFDRDTGEQLWEIESRHGFIHNGIVAGGGQVYCLDRLPASIEAKRKRRGLEIPEYRLVSVDAESGEIKWITEQDVFGSWLGYSREHDLLLQAGAKLKDRLKDEVGQGMVVYKADSGEIKWKDLTRSYEGPCILYHDLIITNVSSYDDSAGVYRIEDGSEYMIKNPLTGLEEPWRIYRTYGCNHAVASENLLTFRSGAAGYYDLESLSGTGNIGGFKSGCTSNLVVANGVLCAPDYTRTCSCSYQNQTSLGLVHMPEIEMWTHNQFSAIARSDERIRRIGVNFGAPGDRRDENGTLWMEYPRVGGRSANVEVAYSGTDVKVIRHHASQANDSEIPWVAASGVIGVERVEINMVAEPDDHDRLVIKLTGAANVATEDDQGRVTIGPKSLSFEQEDPGVDVIGLRFDEVPVGRHFLVKDVYLQFTAERASFTTAQWNIAAELAADASPFELSKHALAQRSTTSAKTWKVGRWKKDESSESQRSPSLLDQFKEIVDLPDWKTGNSINFVLRGKGGRFAKGWSEGRGAPQLVIRALDPERIPDSDTSLLPHHVRLHFFEAEPDQVGATEFGILVQGQPRRVSIDPSGDAATGSRSTVAEFSDVMIGQKLIVEFPDSNRQQTMLSGIEVVADSP